MLVLEDIENGIHPSRLRLLVQLLKSRASQEGPQVMANAVEQEIDFGLINL